MEIARSIRPVKLLSEGHCDAHDTYKGLRCMDCELWICGMCGVLCHKQCRTILVEEAYEEVKMEVSLSLEKELEERNTRIDKINDSLKVLDVKRKELIEELKNCEKKIEELESLKLKEENLCENVNLVKEIIESSSTYEEFSNAKKDVDSLREIGKQHNSIEFQIKLEETAHEEQMPIEVVDCRSLSKEPKLEKNSEMSEVVKILSKEWGDIPSVNGDDLNKANQNAITPTNSSDVEMAEPEVDKRKRLSSEGLDSVTNSPVKSKKPYTQPLGEPIQNSLNTPISKDGLSRKRISKTPRKSTDSESDINEDATITQSADILPADLFSILDRKMNQIHNGLDSPITKDSGHNFCSTKEKDVENYAFSDTDHEVIPKRCQTFTNRKAFSAKKRIRSERMKHDKKRAGDNAEISKLLEYIRTLRNQQSKVKQELSDVKKLNTKLKWKLLKNNGTKASSPKSEIEAFVKFVTDELKKIYAVNEKVEQGISLLLEMQTNAASSSLSLGLGSDILQYLPLCNKMDFKNFNNLLVSDEKKKNFLITWYSNLGGIDFKVCCRTIMSKTVTHSFANEITFTGKYRGPNEKIQFQGTTILGCITVALQNTYRAKESDIHRVIMKWFHNSQDRDGGRQKRKTLVQDNDLSSDTENDRNLFL